MKHKDKSLLHQTGVQELSAQLNDLRKKLDQIEVNRYTKGSKNIRERKTLREKIAVIKTILRVRS